MLSDGPVAVTLGNGEDLATFLVVSSLNATVPVAVSVQELLSFLLAHDSNEFVCYDAAEFFWSCQRALDEAGSRRGINLLWRTAERRLYDVRIMDQRLRSIRLGCFPLPRTLEAIARQSSSAQLPSDADAAASVQAVAATFLSLRQQLNRCVESVTRELGKRAQWLALPSSPQGYELERYGPLAVLLDVQVAIALAGAGNGLLSEHYGMAELIERLSTIIGDRSAVLRSDAEVRRCFHWDGNIVRRGNRGNLKLHADRLHEWLTRRSKKLRDFRNNPLSPPRNDRGDISVTASHWAAFGRVDPLLGAWLEVDSASRLLHTIESGIPLRPFYSTIPFLTSSPNLDIHFELLRPYFGKGKGRKLFSVRLPDLLLRCTAAVSASSGYSPEFRLAQLFANDRDPAAYADYQLAHVSETGAVAAFCQLQQRQRLAALNALLSGFALGWPINSIIAYADERIGGSLPRQHLETIAYCVINKVYWDWEHCLHDPTAEWISGRFGCGDAIWEFHAQTARPTSLEDQRAYTLPWAIRNIILNEHNELGLWNRLLALCSDEQLRVSLQKRGPGIGAYRELLTALPISHYGRVGPSVYAPELLFRQSFQMADDVMKRSAFAAARSGYSLVALTDYEIVLQAPPNAKAGEIAAIVIGAASEFLGEIAKGCCRVDGSRFE